MFNWVDKLLKYIMENQALVMGIGIPVLFTCIDLLIRVALGVKTDDVGADMALLAIAAIVFGTIGSGQHDVGSGRNNTVAIAFLILFLVLLWLLSLFVISEKGDPLGNAKAVVALGIGTAAFGFASVVLPKLREQI